jgi:hypothetical protein
MPEVSLLKYKPVRPSSAGSTAMYVRQSPAPDTVSATPRTLLVMKSKMPMNVEGELRKKLERVTSPACSKISHTAALRQTPSSHSTECTWTRCSQHAGVQARKQAAAPRVGACRRASSGSTEAHTWAKGIAGDRTASRTQALCELTREERIAELGIFVRLVCVKWPARHHVKARCATRKPRQISQRCRVADLTARRCRIMDLRCAATVTHVQEAANTDRKPRAETGKACHKMLKLTCRSQDGASHLGAGHNHARLLVAAFQRWQK